MGLLQNLGRITTGTVSPEGEDAWVNAARKGDRQAFDALTRAHTRHLRGFLARRVGAEAVDDVLQETWLAVWTALPGYKRQARFKAWLFGIALHKINDHHRRLGRHPEVLSVEGVNDPAERGGQTGSPNLLADLVADPHDRYAEVDLRDAVDKALATLPEAQRQVLELYYYAALTLAEIATACGRSESTVKYQFYRAHAQLAEHLEPVLKGGLSVAPAKPNGNPSLRGLQTAPARPGERNSRP